MVTRRDLLARTGMVALGAAARPGGAAARPPSYAADFPDMLLAHLAGKLNALGARWDAERSRIHTPEDVEKRNAFVRDKFKEMIHGFPPRTPLEPVIVNRFERDGYRVENILFQSRPNFWVPANLYIPTVGGPPYPGIISPTGHSAEGRMYRVYQSAYMNLVKNGIAVLAYDAIGQGERRQYWNPQTGETEVGGPTDEHSMPGQLLLLMGEDLTHYRIWDGIRALDYLLTRPEVDPDRVGCAGQSGGGTLTLFISALDQRVKCAVVSEGGTANRWPLTVQPGMRVGPADVEQNLFPAALYGIDLPDLHVAIAPRPLLTLIEDFSPRFNRAADAIRARYAQLGAAAKFATEEAADPHSWTVKLRLATTDWFCRWFYDRPGPRTEPMFAIERMETLACTPDASLRYSHQGETIFSLILKKQTALPPASPVPASIGELQSHRREMVARIQNLLHYEKPEGSLGVRQIVTTPRKGYRVEKLEFISEPGIYIPTWVFLPDGAHGKLPAILYVHEQGKEADGVEFGVLEALARKGNLIVAIDVRGVGETKPPHSPSSDRAGDFRHLFDVETAMSYMAWYMDESLFGMRVRDVVRAVDYTITRRDADPASLKLIGRGMGALWGLYAAALDERIASVVCWNGLCSYRTLTRTDRYAHGANIFIRDVLRYFDLPQVAAAVAPRSATLAAPVDHMKRPMSPAAVRREYQWAADAYRSARSGGRFEIVDRLPGVET